MVDYSGYQSLPTGETVSMEPATGGLEAGSAMDPVLAAYLKKIGVDPAMAATLSANDMKQMAYYARKDAYDTALQADLRRTGKLQSVGTTYEEAHPEDYYNTFGTIPLLSLGKSRWGIDEKTGTWDTAQGAEGLKYLTPDETATYTLYSPRSGQTLGTGTGTQGLLSMVQMAQSQTANKDRKADWQLIKTPAGGGTPEVISSNLYNTNLTTLGKIVAGALPIAVGFIPGLQGVGAVLASAGAGAASAALNEGNILKGALMGGLSAAGGQYLGEALKGTAGLSANAARAIGTGIGSTAGGVVTGQDFGNALLGGIASGGLSYLGGEIMKPGTRNTTSKSGSTSGSSGGGTDPNAIVVNATRLPSLTAPTVNLGSAKPPVAKSTETLDPDAIVVNAGRTPALTSSTFTVPGLTPLPKEIVDYAAKTTEELPPEEQPVGDEITAIGTRNPALTSSTFTVTPLPKDIVDYANAPGKDEIVVKAQKDADTGSANVNTGGGTGANANPDEIVVKAQKDANTGSANVNTGGGTGANANPDEIVVTATKKTDADTGSSTLTVPGLTPLPKEITDLANKDTVADDKDKLGVKEALALLGLLGGLGGGGGGSGTGTGTGGKFQSIFNQKLPTPGQDGALMVGGLKGPTKGPAGTYSARPVTDWYRFGMGPAMDIPAGTDLSRATSPYAGYGPGTLGEETFRAVSGIPAASPEQPAGMAHGGSMGYARGSSRDSFAVEGPGTGRSDDIPAVLSDGEYVIDAETVALLGDGSSKAGAKKLDQMRVNIRKHKGRNLAKGKFSVNAKAPERYLSGGRA